MNYHPDDFFALIAEVEDQGGVHLQSETCKPPVFRMNLPIDEDNPQGPKHNVRVHSTGCNRRAKFLVSLRDVDDRDFEEDEKELFDFDGPQRMMTDGETPALAKVCAVDDSMGLWPRFQDAMQTGESFEPFE